MASVCDTNSLLPTLKKLLTGYSLSEDRLLGNLLPSRQVPCSKESFLSTIKLTFTDFVDRTAYSDFSFLYTVCPGGPLKQLCSMWNREDGRVWAHKDRFKHCRESSAVAVITKHSNTKSKCYIMHAPYSQVVLLFMRAEIYGMYILLTPKIHGLISRLIVVISVVLF